jgi:hypothetical protein
VSVEGIPEPIRRSMRILATHRALFGTRGRARATMSELDISRVVAVFKSNRTAWALVGAHAIGLLTEPRATAGSIAEIGQQVPVIVIGDGERYVLIDGYLRVEALLSGEAPGRSLDLGGVRMA